MWPPNKILFPIDFSERSISAARYVRSLGCRFRPEITLMHVLPPPAYGVGSLESGPLMVEEAWEEQQRRAQQDVAEFAARELGPFRVHPMVLEGDPATAILEKAHSERADLIVMATHGYARFRRFILGSVTAKVLHDADCPVWTGAHLPAVPAAEQASQQAPIKQVVCAVDLSAHSENVLDWAARLAGSFEARLFLIHAIPALAPAEEDYYQQDGREDLQAWPDGPARLSWSGIVYFVVRPTWIRYSDFDQNPPLIREFDFRSSARIVRDQAPRIEGSGTASRGLKRIHVVELFA